MVIPLSNRKLHISTNRNKENNKNLDNTLNNLDNLISRTQRDSRLIRPRSSGSGIPLKGLVAIGLVVIFVLSLSSFFNSPQPTDINPYPEKTLPGGLPSKYDTDLTSKAKLTVAYDFANSSGQVMSQLICYCGCNNQMHQPYHATARECFWTSEGAYEGHAENCSTCVYIALSAKALYEGGWTPQEIRVYIDSQYD